MRFAAAIFIATIVFTPVVVLAQTTQQTLVLGGSGNVVFAPDQKILFDASNAFVSGDYKNANRLYSQAIAINGSNIDAYLQRAAVRREMHDTSGMQSDAQTVIALANRGLEQNSNNPTLYYERGMGYRLLKQFDQARDDITKGMQIGGKSNWDTDLKAIELERKYAE